MPTEVNNAIMMELDRWNVPYEFQNGFMRLDLLSIDVEHLYLVKSHPSVSDATKFLIDQELGRMQAIIGEHDYAERRENKYPLYDRKEFARGFKGGRERP